MSKNTQKSPEENKPGPVMRYDKAYQEIKQILKPGSLSFFMKNPGHNYYKFHHWLRYHYKKHLTLTS